MFPALKGPAKLMLALRAAFSAPGVHRLTALVIMIKSAFAYAC